MDIVIGVLTGLIHRITERFGQALAGHFHEADGGNLENLGLRLVAFDPLFHRLVNGGLVFAMTHVDEIDHDQATDIAEAELTCDFLGGFDVGLENHFIDIFGAAVAARVDVD
jgi:hypothetical protein